MREKALNHFNAMRTAVFKTLGEVTSKFSLTIDGWTSISNRSYYGITMHFIDDEWKLQSLPLDFIPSNGLHTGKDIASLVLDVLDQFEIKSKIQGITMDNAAANSTFMIELSDLLFHEDISFDSVNCHFRCFAHILNLGVQDTLRALSPVCNHNNESFNDDDSDEENLQFHLEQSDKTNVIDKIRRLFLKIKRSEQWANKLRSFCEALNIKQLTTAIDVSTRWNSTYRMLRTALNLKTALNTLIQSTEELRDMRIKPEEWDVLNTVCAYLKPFDYLSTVLGGQAYVTLPLLIVGFNMLIDRIEEVVRALDEKPHRSQTDEKLLTAFQTGRDKMLVHYRKTNWIYGVVLILDPRHKVKTFSLTTWGQNLMEESVKMFENIFKEQYCPACSAPQSPILRTISSSQEDNDRSFDLFALYESASEISQATNCGEWRVEFERYVKEKRANRNEDILQWWQRNSATFPNLAKMARDFLSIPATSVLLKDFSPRLD